MPALSGLPRSLSAWGPLGAPLQALGVGLASDGLFVSSMSFNLSPSFVTKLSET